MRTIKIKGVDVTNHSGEQVTVAVYGRTDGLYDVTTLSGDTSVEDETYLRQGVDLLTARCAYATEVLRLAGAD